MDDKNNYAYLVVADMLNLQFIMVFLPNHKYNQFQKKVLHSKQSLIAFLNFDRLLSFN